MQLIIFCEFLVLFAKVFALPNCKESEVTYITTPCSAAGGHYFIQLPKDPTTCTINFQPKYVPDCKQTCPKGQFLNASSDNCDDCLPGTSSQGDTFEVNSWLNWPIGFHSDVISVDKVSCIGYGWHPSSAYLLGKSSPKCSSELTLVNTNIKTGSINFSYQFTDQFALAYFTVRNDRCVLNDGMSYALPRTGNNGWRSFSTNVPIGVSTLQWYLFSENIFAPNSAIAEFKLKWVQVTGRAASAFCNTCEPGYFANETRSEKCSMCPKDTFSEGGASSCTKCPEDHFSLPGSSNCSERKPCKDTEYITSYSSCSSKTDKQVLETNLIEPVICKDTLSAANEHPLEEEEADCKTCPSGTKLFNATNCESCPSGFVSNREGTECHACPNDEAPIFGINYTTWSRMPPLVSTYCPESDLVCQPWKVNGSSIFVGPGLDRFAHSVLELNLPDGFVYSNYAEASSADFTPLNDSRLVFDFEVECQGTCTLLFTVSTTTETFLIKEWIGNVRRTKFTYEPTDAGESKFLWLFKKVNSHGSEWDPTTRSDRVVIYSIAATNTYNTGALGCKRCPLGIIGQFCKPCDEGLFFTTTTDPKTGALETKCIPCPEGTMAIKEASTVMNVDQACIRCAPGTYPVPSGKCAMDLHPLAPTGQFYNFSWLMKEQFSVEGPRLFTSQGQEYKQRFNLALNTLQLESRSTCVDDEEEDSVKSWICRETLIMLKDKMSGVVYPRHSDPISLGDKFTLALSTNSSPAFGKEINSKLINAGWKADESGNDYHLYFETTKTTSACPGRMKTVVTLRCERLSSSEEELSNSAVVAIPPNCVVGTCDGCQFHFLIHSHLACPICNLEDYRRIEGGCFSGSKEVTLIPPKTCRPKENFPFIFTESCPFLSIYGKIAVGTTCAVIVLLVLIILHCHRRSVKLEYKYMQLVEGAEARVRGSFGGDRVLDQGRECGIPEDEYDTEIYRQKPISAIAGGITNKWNELTSTSRDAKSGGFGPVIFRNRTADDSHILTLDDGNGPETMAI